ncbi:MAG: PQQ-binding-like beta-propeller repeat protein [Ardenticatenales bacterium]|nr:PQQ-binding-like beta-propeller repeat protein [Ardenticatenales bacterium]
MRCPVPATRLALLALALSPLFLLVLLSGSRAAPTAAAPARQAHHSPPRPAAVADALRAQGNGPTARALAVETEYDALRVPDAPALSPAQAVSIELWLKRKRATGCSALVSKGRSTGYWLGVCDGRLRFSVGGQAVDGATVLAESRWLHVAATYDGATVSLYIDGTLDRAAALRRPLDRVATPLVLGADAAPGAVFSGGIDHVRLWGLARTATDIRADRYATLSARSGLIGQWPLDGDGRDLAGGHDGDDATGAFGFDGALPRDLVAPLATGTVAADGVCGGAEYGTAERVALDGPDVVTAFVQVTSDALWVCLTDLPRPTGANAFVGVLLDRNRSGDARTQLGDYRILARYAGVHTVEEGDGNGGWKVLTLPNDSWTVGRTSTGTLGSERWTAEIRIARSLLEPPRDPDEPVGVGLAVAYSGLRAAGDDRLWPSGATLGAPQGWAAATLAEETGLVPRYAFSGTVVQPTEDDPAKGVAGAVVQLLATDDLEGGALRLIDTDVTDGGGAYRLAYRGYPPAGFVVRQTNARGTRSVAADPGPRGRAAGADLVWYAIDADDPTAERTFGGGRFVDAAAPAPAPALDRHYLIVYAPPVTEADLEPLVRLRSNQGFQVMLRSTDELLRVGEGRDLAERIQRWLAATWRAVEPAPVYALLVGRGNTIPVRDIGWHDNDHRDPLRGGYYPAWPTDWYYADVDSEWDADGDGYYGEFMRCRPGDTYPESDMDDDRDEDADDERDCPEAGSLSREGPFGELRGTADDFRAEIAVGRLPLGEPAEVRRAVAGIIAAETGGVERRRALLAGSFWSWEGESWSAERPGSVPGGDVLASPWIRAKWDGQQPFGHDAAEALEGSVRPALTGLLPEIRRLYASTSPDFDPTLVPTRHSPDVALSAAAFAQEWQRGVGLAVVAGRGAADGVYGGSWTRDADGDRRIDQPAPPSACPQGVDETGGCQDLTIERFVDGNLPAPASPPIVIANAGGTGGVAWTWDGVDAGGGAVGLRLGPSAVPSTLLGRGRAAAWVGSFGPIEPGDLDAFQAALADDLVADGLRLGVAHGNAAGVLARGGPYDPRRYGTAVLGDPAQLYWGGAADTLGPWPGDGGGWRADGASPFAGPTVPEVAWTSRDQGPGTPVVIGRTGEPIAVGSGGAVQLTPGGAVARQAVMGAAAAAARYAPAIGVGGAYVAAGSSLLALNADLTLRSTILLPSGGQATGAPRLDPDGVVWQATTVGLARIDPAGRATILYGDPAVGAAAILPSGEIVWSTSDGRVLAWQPGSNLPARPLGAGPLGEITGPAVSPEGTVYVGTAGGRVNAYPDERAGWQVDAGGAVRARPSVAADGTLVVGTARGDVIAFAAERTERLWTTRLAGGIDAGVTLDGRQAYAVAGASLHALDLATGAVLWTVDLGGATDARSTPVLSADRTLYVTRADRAIVAVREAGWLAPPSNVRLAAANGALVVAWRDNSTTESGFHVELCDTDGMCTDAGTAPAGATQLEIRRPSFAAGHVVTARVGAMGPEAGGGARLAEATLDSELSVSEPAAVPPGRPVSPAALTAESTAPGEVTLRWRYDADAGLLRGFTIARMTEDDGNWQPVALVGADVRSFVDTGVAADTAYRFRITAESDDGTADSATADATTWRISDSAPRDVRAAQTGDQLILTWRNHTTSHTGVLVERLDPGMATFHVVGRLAPSAQRFVDGVELLSGVYTYRIRTTREGEATKATWFTVRVGEANAGKVYLPLATTYRRR